MHKLPCLTALLATTLVPALSMAAEHVEAVFEDAKSYTAYVETRIEVPFIEDQRSSFYGAGFVVDEERRWILTNAHVTGKSPAEIFVMFSDYTRVRAAPIYIDSYLDLAVLAFEQPEGLELTEAELECDSTPGTGHPVGTFGHPKGLRFTGTRGIISGRTSLYGSEWLQTDAPISGGNSGGPLISLETGKVVGINSATIDDDGAQNANLAVLSTQACRIIELMAAGHDPRPADLGVAFFDHAEDPTTVVGQVYAGGREIGLRRGDQIFSVNGTLLDRTTEGELLHQLRGQLNEAELEIVRGGQEMKISASLPPRPSMIDRKGVYVGGALFSVTNHVDIAGLDLKPVLMVHTVEYGSAAEAAGIATYDHLLGVDGRRIDSLDDLIAITATRQSNEPAELDLVRFVGEENRFLQDVMAEIYLDSARLIAFPR